MNGFLLCLISPTLRPMLSDVPKESSGERRVVLDDVDEDIFRKVVDLACCKTGAHASEPEEVFALAKLAERLGAFAVRDAMTDAAKKLQNAIAQAAAELAMQKTKEELAKVRAAAEVAAEEAKRQVDALRKEVDATVAKAEADIAVVKTAAEASKQQSAAILAATGAEQQEQMSMLEEMKQAALEAERKADKEKQRMSEELAKVREAARQAAEKAAAELEEVRGTTHKGAHKAKVDLANAKAAIAEAACKAAMALAKAKAEAELTTAHMADLARKHAKELRRVEQDAAAAQAAADRAVTRAAQVLVAVPAAES